jgi:hypothetical protein
MLMTDEPIVPPPAWNSYVYVPSGITAELGVGAGVDVAGDGDAVSAANNMEARIIASMTLPFLRPRVSYCPSRLGQL